MFGFLRRRRDSPPAEPRPIIVTIPEDGRVIYAVGDIHGCDRQLVALEEAILEAEAGSGRATTIIHLGDMIDRGPDSAFVLDHLMRPLPEGFERICILGNHEAAMLRTLEDAEAAGFWFANGGLETLLSYGVHVPSRPTSRRDSRALVLEAGASIPAEHVDFLRRLPIAVMHPRFFFVHAGIRAGVPLAAQKQRDLLEIREPVTGPAPSHIIVHGHTPVREAENRPHEIIVDTGCYATGRLSAVRIDGVERDFLWVTGG